MDILLLTNIVLVLFFFFLKWKNKQFIAFYSISLLLGILTCGYVFYRYGMRELASTVSEMHFFSSPLLLTLDIFLLFRQRKSQDGLGIPTLLSESPKKYLDRIFPAIIFFVAITTLCYLFVYFYEGNLPKPTRNEAPSWSLTVTHFLWQFFYIIPLAIIFWLMELRKFTWTFVICSIIYPFCLLLWLYL